MQTFRERPLSRRLAPQMNELATFEAAARLLSFTQAAAELNLTQGAVSRTIAKLELRLQTQLFERVKQRIVLTEQGGAFYRDLEPALNQLLSASRRVMMNAAPDETLNLAVLPTFATHWLVPRLPLFQERNPHAVVNLETRIRPFPFPDDRFDAAIHHGKPAWRGGRLHLLMDESMVPMCSPAYRDRWAIHRPADLSRVTLIHQSTRRSAWMEWHELAGIGSDRVWRGPVYDQFGMAAAAAAAHLGVSLLPRFLVQQQIDEGRLETLFDLPVRLGSAYYLVLPDQGAKPVALKLAEWITKQLAVEHI
jgi:LysR family glycine cleavage system transcriptional activator